MVLTRRASLAFRTYSVLDFPELDLSSVEHINAFSKENVMMQVIEAQSRNALNIHRDRSRDIDIEEYRKSLKLILQEPGKANVLRAIRLLERRNDIYAVSPNYFSSFPEFYASYEESLGLEVVTQPE